MLGHSIHRLKLGATGRCRLPHLRIGLCTRRICAALALSALAGTAAQAKDPQIIVSDTIRVVQGGEAELVVKVEPGDTQLDGGRLGISGANMPFTLSQGRETSGTWVLEFAHLKGLKIRLPEASSGRTKLLLFLFSEQDGVQDVAEVNLIVEPAATAADAVAKLSVPKAAETTPAPAAMAASSPTSTLVARTSPLAGNAPAPEKIEAPAPKVEPVLVTATPQPVMTPHRAADKATQPASPATSPSPPQAAPTTVAVVTWPAPVARPEASVELKEQWQRLIGFGQRQLAQGNISYARQYFLRAAETGSATAALRLAETYDGEQLRRLNVIGVKAEADQARHWYERAGQLGANEAADRLLHFKVQ